MIESYKRSKAYSEDKLSLLRTSLNFIPDDGVCVTFGSYARREASASSDLDHIFIASAGSSFSEDFLENVRAKIEGIVVRPPSPGGAFSELVLAEDMLKNLGGEKDTNGTITRRVLLLLEGDWLSNQGYFDTFRRALIERYVSATPRDHQLALFLLNDIIRYWRTMTVDYMYKTTEDDKPWAVRNIKLSFSRKLMYAGGLFSVGMTLDHGIVEKCNVLERLLALPVIERLTEICGPNEVRKVLNSYEFFLEKMEDAGIREALNQVEVGDRENETFRSLKNESHRFTRELMSLFENQFHSTHPIRKAVVF